MPVDVSCDLVSCDLVTSRCMSGCARSEDEASCTPLFALLSCAVSGTISCAVSGTVSCAVSGTISCNVSGTASCAVSGTVSCGTISCTVSWYCWLVGSSVLCGSVSTLCWVGVSILYCVGVSWDGVDISILGGGGRGSLT